MAAVLIVIGVIIVFLLIGGWVIGLAFSLLWFVLIGILIGALARAVLPGRQAIGWLGTAGAGIAGSLLGENTWPCLRRRRDREVPRGRRRPCGAPDRDLQRRRTRDR